MRSADPNIGDTRPNIRQLDEAAINRIAAGEVVERPASAVKELVENAIDAGARRITIDYADGGKTLIRVQDDGCGLTKEDLPLALCRHATSKIDGSDLLNIHTFGFRGEALPSLSAVGRLTLMSRAQGHAGVELTVDGGKTGTIKPTACNQGTTVTLRDLFYATPARLKFLRTDRAEAQAIADVVKRLAMAEPFVSFALRDVSGEDKTREVFRADVEQGELFGALRGRLGRILGRDFTENAIPIDATREDLHLSGFAALPTYSRGAAIAQFFFVNGRPVRDKLLIGALRAAYFDFLSRDRHPVAALFLECDPRLVDVNVHPAKSEVRFRDPGIARGLVVSGLRHALAEAGHRAATTVAHAALAALTPENTPGRIYQMDRTLRSAPAHFPQDLEPAFAEAATPWGRIEAPEPVTETDAPPENYPLGTARGQVHENYIIAQTESGIVIVDQHAAHERLVYEKLKAQMAEKGVPAQALLIPEIVEVSAGDCARLLEVADDLRTVGLVIEPFGGTALAVRETPAILGNIDARGLLLDVLDELSDQSNSTIVRAKIDAILSRMSCHGSIRSGRQMRAEEMNALLREMEQTPHSGQCNHGRPTYVELKLSDIEKLFGRT
ncbi:MAG: DNA mismatch repair endonuclease MutL [Roseobacter sp.]